MSCKWLSGALGCFTHCASGCNLVWRKGGRLTGLWKGQPADSNLKTDQGAPFGSWQLHVGQRDEVYLHSTTYNVNKMLLITYIQIYQLIFRPSDHPGAGFGIYVFFSSSPFCNFLPSQVPPLIPGNDVQLQSREEIIKLFWM